MTHRGTEVSTQVTSTNTRGPKSCPNHNNHLNLTTYNSNYTYHHSITVSNLNNNNNPNLDDKKLNHKFY